MSVIARWEKIFHSSAWRSSTVGILAGVENRLLINIENQTLHIYGSCKCFFFSRSHISENTGEWQKIYDIKEPQSFQLPEQFNNTLNELQKMIILRCLRPDKVK